MEEYDEKREHRVWQERPRQGWGRHFEITSATDRWPQKWRSFGDVHLGSQKERREPGNREGTPLSPRAANSKQMLLTTWEFEESSKRMARDTRPCALNTDRVILAVTSTLTVANDHESYSFVHTDFAKRGTRQVGGRRLRARGDLATHQVLLTSEFLCRDALIV